MLKILRISDVIGMKIFTDFGDYVGSVEEAEEDLNIAKQM